MSYLAWKLLHIIAVTLFMGNITTGLFWARRAFKSRDLKQVATTFDNISRSDRLFTVPAVIAIVVSGFAMALNAKIPVLGTGWVFWPIVLFSLSGAVFGIWVAPLQRKITKLAGTDGVEWATLQQMLRSWELWGGVALATPAAALVIMVLKPSLPGL